MGLALVAAVAENGVIGADGRMPWHYPEDLRRFKRLTTGHPVIAGRRTFEAVRERLGGPLPDRTNVVLSRGDPDLPAGVVRAGSLDAGVEAAAATGADVAYVIGGATVYEAALQRADRMHITEVPGRPEGDTYFPEWDPEEWVEVDREPGSDGELSFVTYERRRE